MCCQSVSLMLFLKGAQNSDSEKPLSYPTFTVYQTILATQAFVIEEIKKPDKMVL